MFFKIIRVLYMRIYLVRGKGLSFLVNFGLGQGYSCILVVFTVNMFVTTAEEI